MKVVNININGYPHISGKGESILMVVLTKGVVGEYACYAAIVDLTLNLEKREKAKEKLSYFVAGQGIKLNYEQARGHFPNLKKSEYRV